MDQRPGAGANVIPADADFWKTTQTLDLGVNRQKQAISRRLVVVGDIEPNALEILPRPSRYDDFSHARPRRRARPWRR